MTLQWVKVYGALPRHHKTLHLRQLVGPRAFDFTVRALLWLSEFRPTGSLEGLRPEAIEAGVEWDGQPGDLFAAWKEVGFIGADGCWHDWGEVQGAHKQRAEWKENKKRGRSTPCPGDVPRTSSDVLRTEGVCPEDLSSHSPLGSSDQDPEIAQDMPTSTIPQVDNRFTRKVHGQPRHDMWAADKAQRAPKSPAEVLAAKDPKTGFPLGETWRQRFPCLDGKGGRHSVDELVAVIFAHWTTTMVQQGKTPWEWPTTAIGKFTDWLADAHTKAKKDKRVDNGGKPSPHDVDVDAILSRQKPGSW